MSGARDFTEAELELVRKSFSGRYMLRDRCYFEIALQMGLRVSEMLSLTVGQVYQAGKVVDEVSIERKHMKGGKLQPIVKPAHCKDGCNCKPCKLWRGEVKPKPPSANGRTLPLFGATKPYILAWLQLMTTLLQVKDIQAIGASTPLFLSRVHNGDGSLRAIDRSTAWRIIKGIARENDLSSISTHSTRKTLAQRGYSHAKSAGIPDPMRFVQKLLGHKSISSTEHYVESLNARAAWESYRGTFKAA